MNFVMLVFSNNLAAWESIRLLLETLESFIFVSDSGANQAALPQGHLVSATELVSRSRKDMMKSITELTVMKIKRC
jgi:hypothetical protein